MLTVLNRLVLSACPRQQFHAHQSSNGDVPACRFSQPSVAGLLVCQVPDAKSRALPCHSHRIVAGVRGWGGCVHRRQLKTHLKGLLHQIKKEQRKGG